MNNKKGQFGSLQSIILTIVIVGILLGIAFMVFEEMEDQSRNDYTATQINETLPTSINETPIYVAYNTTSVSCFDGISWSYVSNSTGGETIEAANYTTSTNGSIWFSEADDASGYNNSIWNVTYTYTHGGEGCIAIEEVTDATATIPAWLTIIIILLIVGILLTILFQVVIPSMGGRGSGSASGTIAEV